MSTIYMVVGCPGSGKSWVCSQLTDSFHHVPHDASRSAVEYVHAIRCAAVAATKPLLIETPFSVSQIKGPLEAGGHRVVPFFIQEHPMIIAARYRAREGKDIPHGHLTRQETYRQRAEALKAFQGPSGAVLAALKQIAHEQA